MADNKGAKQPEKLATHDGSSSPDYLVQLESIQKIIGNNPHLKLIKQLESLRSYPKLVEPGSFKNTALLVEKWRKEIDSPKTFNFLKNLEQLQKQASLLRKLHEQINPNIRSFLKSMEDMQKPAAQLRRLQEQTNLNVQALFANFEHLQKTTQYSADAITANIHVREEDDTGVISAHVSPLITEEQVSKLEIFLDETISRVRLSPRTIQAFSFFFSLAFAVVLHVDALRSGEETQKTLEELLVSKSSDLMNKIDLLNQEVGSLSDDVASQRITARSLNITDSTYVFTGPGSGNTISHHLDANAIVVEVDTREGWIQAQFYDDKQNEIVTGWIQSQHTAPILIDGAPAAE